MSRSGPRSREQLAHDVVLLEKQGLKRRAIARSLHIARKTVKKLLDEHASTRSEGHTALPPPPTRMARPSKVDVYRTEAAQLLKTFPDITAQRVFEELRGKGFSGGYTAVKVLVRKLRPGPTVEPSLHAPVYGPGQMAECDWSPYTIEFTHAPAREVQGFSYALFYSHRKYFDFFDRNDVHALMDGHLAAFSHFGGAARETKYDVQKPVVLRFEGRQPIYNPRFLDFATYYEFALRICRPGHPNDKPRVERSFWELVRSFFNGRRFRDEADLHAQLRWWMSNVSDLRPEKKDKQHTRLERFALEQPELRPLPTRAYDTARVIYRHCDIEGFVPWDGNRYAVPYDHVTDILPLRITRQEVFIYDANLHLIARHELRIKSAGEDAGADLYHPRAHRGPDPELLRKAFADLGPTGAEFFSRLAGQKPRSAGYHARQILVLRQRFHTDELVKALAHALRFSALDHAAVERILRARAPMRPLEEYLARQIDERWTEPPTCPRDPAEYDALPRWRRSQPNQGAISCLAHNHAVVDAAPPPPALLQTAHPETPSPAMPPSLSGSDATVRDCD